MLNTILITGGAGFIGSTLADALLRRGDRVITVDNFEPYYDPARKRTNIKGQLDHPNYTFIEADIRDRDGVMDIFREHQPGRVAHIAAMAGVRYSIERATEFTQVNTQGSINVLDAARAVEVDNVVMASTSSIYGQTEQIPFSEDQPTDHPLAPYPASKKAAELMAHAYHNLFDMNITALRFFTVYGPRVRPDMMAHMVMERTLRGETIPLFNGGDFKRDWTYVDDIVRGVVAAIDTPLGFEIMNIGRGEPVHLLEFIQVLEELIGQPVPWESKPAPASEPPITYASIEKARRLLSYDPQISIGEGLARTWAWYQQEIMGKG